MDEWVEQHEQQRATWELRAIRVQAAPCNLGARLVKANKDT